MKANNNMGTATINGKEVSYCTGMNESVKQCNKVLSSETAIINGKKIHYCTGRMESTAHYKQVVSGVVENIKVKLPLFSGIMNKISFASNIL